MIYFITDNLWYLDLLKGRVHNFWITSHLSMFEQDKCREVVLSFLQLPPRKLAPSWGLPPPLFLHKHKPPSCRATDRNSVCYVYYWDVQPGEGEWLFTLWQNAFWVRNCVESLTLPLTVALQTMGHFSFFTFFTVNPFFSPFFNTLIEYLNIQRLYFNFNFILS